ncbi:MAG: hypothetical protein LUQ25_09520 [Methanoregulaceae archaeon]|nr:hypothetical protein [Methanoregulaceae archaeon]
MTRTQLLVIFLVIGAIVAVSGCTSTQGGQGPSGSAPAFTTGPTQVIPSEKRVEIQVNEKDPIYNTIPVIFAGGEGQVAVTSIEVKMTPEGGRTETQLLRPEKGAQLTFQGTRGTDRVEATVRFTDGSSYKVVDQLVPYRTRG